MCVAGALSNYTKILTNPSMYSGLLVTDALQFIVHFMGDIHQPLHVGFTSDKGGNTIKVRFEGDKTNLHALWDSGIISQRESENFNDQLQNYQNYLMKQIQPGGKYYNELNSWTLCSQGDIICTNEWATESIKDACQYAYANIENGASITDNYYKTRYPVIELRLLQGGVRLAAILNDILQ